MRENYLSDLRHINSIFYNYYIESEININNPVIMPKLQNEAEIKNLIESDGELKKEYDLYRAYNLIDTVTHYIAQRKPDGLIEQTKYFGALSKNPDYSEQEKEIFEKAAVFARIAEIATNIDKVNDREMLLIQLNEELTKRWGDKLGDDNFSKCLDVIFIQTGRLAFYGQYAVRGKKLQYLEIDTIENASEEELQDLVEKKLANIMKSLRIDPEWYKAEFKHFYDSIFNKQIKLLHELIEEEKKIQREETQEEKISGLSTAGIIIGVGGGASFAGAAVGAYFWRGCSTTFDIAVISAFGGAAVLSIGAGIVIGVMGMQKPAEIEV